MLFCLATVASSPGKSGEADGNDDLLTESDEEPILGEDGVSSAPSSPPENLYTYSSRRHRVTLVCPICLSFHTSEALMYAHLAAIHLQYVCPGCKQSFADVTTLQGHLVQHRGGMKFMCSHCGRGLATRHECVAHERVHTAEKPYSCTECGKGFSQRGTLDVHMPTHTGERPYQCSHCKRSFRSLSNLRVHQRLHNGER